jgi:hypothetical protein
MKGSQSKELSEKQQLLLSSYVDNECSFLSRFLAERLVKTNEKAQLFVHNLKNTSQACKAHIASSDPSVDLWDRISARIDGEERAALYLGQRKPVVNTSASLMEKLLSRQAVLGGLSGAAVAATVLVFVSRPSKPGEILPVYTGGPVAAHKSSAFHQASLGNESQAFGNQSAMEVDWMRGNGSFKIIQNPTDKSAIIWVRKRPFASSAPNQAIKATPTIRVLNEQGLDVMPPRTAK